MDKGSVPFRELKSINIDTRNTFAIGMCINLIKNYEHIFCIRCTTLLPPFFSEIRGFIVKN